MTAAAALVAAVASAAAPAVAWARVASPPTPRRPRARRRGRRHRQRAAPEWCWSLRRGRRLARLPAVASRRRRRREVVGPRQRHRSWARGSLRGASRGVAHWYRVIATSPRRAPGGGRAAGTPTSRAAGRRCPLPVSGGRAAQPCRGRDGTGSSIWCGAADSGDAGDVMMASAPTARPVAGFPPTRAAPARDDKCYVAGCYDQNVASPTSTATARRTWSSPTTTPTPASTRAPARPSTPPRVSPPPRPPACATCTTWRSPSRATRTTRRRPCRRTSPTPRRRSPTSTATAGARSSCSPACRTRPRATARRASRCGSSAVTPRVAGWETPFPA